MADQPIDQTAPPAADPNAPPAVATPAPEAAPVIPGQSQSDRATAIAGSMAPFQAKEQQATQNAADLANKSTAPPPPGPHARLLSMVQGLALGLDAFGKSIATGGREGGVQEVQQVRAEQQRQEVQAQQAREAQKNSQIQQQLMVADTNHKLAQNVLLMATLPNELAKSDLELKKGQTELAGAQQGQAITGADFVATHGGMNPQEFTTALSSSAPASTQTGSNTFFVTNAQQQLDAATKILGGNDSYVKQLQETLANPKATPKDVWTATNRVQSQTGFQEKATEAQTKKEAAAANSPVGKLSTPEALVAPGAVDAINAKIKDPATDPNDVPRLQALIPLAEKAQANKLEMDRRQKQMEQDVQSGDPRVIGEEMGSGLAAPSQVLSARSMSKPFYSKVLAEADNYMKAHGAPEIVDANGKGTGHYFNAEKAEAQYKYALNPQTQNVLNMVDALDAKGGVADILLEKGKALPTVGVPKFNSWEQALAYQTGGKALPAYMPAAVDFADMYGKVMGGGTASDSARLEAINLVLGALNGDQRAAAVNTLKETLKQRGNHIVRDNPTLGYMYPNLKPNASAESATPSGKSVSLAAAMQLPVNKGKTEDQVRADIIAHGHQVGQ